MKNNKEHEWVNSFDLYEPNSGHRERFSKKLKKKSSRIKTKILVGIAASVALLSFFLFTQTKPDLKTKTNDIICFNKELQEIEYYYSSQEINRINKIKSFPIDSNLYHSEILEIDSIVNKLCIELETSADDEKVIEAAVNHYQMKIKTLDHILKQLKSINHYKKQENEEISL